MVGVGARTTVREMTGFIPSPSGNGFSLGPLHFHAYGLMIALGAFAAWTITRRRWARTGGDPDDVDAIAVWAVPAGLDRRAAVSRGHRQRALSRSLAECVQDLGRGARHLGWCRFGRGRRLRGGAPPASRRRRSARRGRPGLAGGPGDRPVGNYFNQELFGRPTTLPWGLRHRCHQPSPPATPSTPRSTRPSSTRRCGTSPGRRIGVAGPPGRAAAAAGELVRALHRGLHAGPGMGRAVAHRPRQPDTRPAPQRLDLHRRCSAPPWSCWWCATAPNRPLIGVRQRKSPPADPDPIGTPY